MHWEIKSTQRKATFTLWNVDRITRLSKILMIIISITLLNISCFISKCSNKESISSCQRSVLVVQVIAVRIVNLFAY